MPGSRMAARPRKPSLTKFNVSAIQDDTEFLVTVVSVYDGLQHRRFLQVRVAPLHVRLPLFFQPPVEFRATHPDAATDPDRWDLPVCYQLVGTTARDPKDRRHLRYLEVFVLLRVHIHPSLSCASVGILWHPAGARYRNNSTVSFAVLVLTGCFWRTSSLLPGRLRKRTALLRRIPQAQGSPGTRHEASAQYRPQEGASSLLTGKAT